MLFRSHTDAKPFSAGERGYSNWELSADRANASRRELITGGLSGIKILRVQGLSASVLFDKDDPMNPVNRRISIIVMNREAEDRFFKAANADEIKAEDEEPAASPPPEQVDIRPSRPDMPRR